MGVYTPDQWQELFHAKKHPRTIQLHRAKIISNQLGFFSLVFAILVPAWIVIDIALLPASIRQHIGSP